MYILVLFQWYHTFLTMTMSDIIIEDVSDHGSCGVLLYSDKVVAEGFMKYVSWMVSQWLHSSFIIRTRNKVYILMSLQGKIILYCQFKNYIIVSSVTLFAESFGNTDITWIKSLSILKNFDFNFYFDEFNKSCGQALESNSFLCLLKKTHNFL